MDQKRLDELSENCQNNTMTAGDVPFQAILEDVGKDVQIQFV